MSSPDSHSDTPMNEKKKTNLIKQGIRFGLKEYNDANIMTNAAVITLWTFMSVFPLLMLLMAAVPYLPITLDDMLGFVMLVFPDAMVDMIQQLVRDMYTKSISQTGITVNILMVIWASSSGVNAFSRGLNDAYRSGKKRSWAVHRALSIGYTFIFILVILALLLSFVMGHQLAREVVSVVPGLRSFRLFFHLFSGWISVVLAIGFFMVIYKVMTRTDDLLIMQLPGALVATLGWVIFSAIYSAYLKSIVYYSVVYGSMASFAAMIIWLWVCMQFVLAGAEVNYLVSIYGQVRKQQRDLQRTVRRLEKELARIAPKLDEPLPKSSSLRSHRFEPGFLEIALSEDYDLSVIAGVPADAAVWTKSDDKIPKTRGQSAGRRTKARKKSKT